MLGGSSNFDGRPGRRLLATDAVFLPGAQPNQGVARWIWCWHCSPTVDFRKPVTNLISWSTLLQAAETDGLESGAPVGSRTPNLLIRSQMLYPIELRVRDRT